MHLWGLWGYMREMEPFKYFNTYKKIWWYLKGSHMESHFTRGTPVKTLVPFGVHISDRESRSRSRLKLDLVSTWSLPAHMLFKQKKIFSQLSYLLPPFNLPLLPPYLTSTPHFFGGNLPRGIVTPPWLAPVHCFLASLFFVFFVFFLSLFFGSGELA